MNATQLETIRSNLTYVFSQQSFYCRFLSIYLWRELFGETLRLLSIWIKDPSDSSAEAAFVSDCSYF